MNGIVFVSYSSLDEPTARELTDYLHASGVRTWVDRTEIVGADTWTSRIVEALATAKVFIVLLSSNSLESQHVLRELTLASERNIPILPIELEDISLKGSFSYYLAGIHRVSIRNLPQILEALKSCAIDVATLQDNTASETQRSESKASGIAVLPFEDISPLKDSTYLAEGITEELISKLTKIASLRVRSRASVLGYISQRGTDRLSKSLQVRYLVEGSIRRHGDKLRISFRLSETATDSVLCAEVLDGQIEDVLQFQEDVASQILHKLRGRLTSGEDRVVKKRPTEDPEAYELLLRAKEYLNRRTHRSLKTAERLFHSVLERDRSCAIALVGLARTHLDYLQLYQDQGDHLLTAERYAIEAINCDPELDSAHMTLSLIYLAKGEPNAAISEANKVLASEPNNANSHFQLGYIYGKLKNRFAAIQHYQKCVELDPYNLIAYYNLVNQLRQDGDLVQLRSVALKGKNYFEQHLELHPDDCTMMLFYAALLPHLDKSEEMLKTIEDVTGPVDVDVHLLCIGAALFAQNNEADRAMNLIQRALDRGVDPKMISQDPDLTVLVIALKDGLNRIS